MQFSTDEKHGTGGLTKAEPDAVQHTFNEAWHPEAAIHGQGCRRHGGGLPAGQSSRRVQHAHIPQADGSVDQDLFPRPAEERLR